MRSASVCRVAIAAAMLVAAAAPVVAQAPAQAANPAIDSIFAAWDSTSTPGCALAVYRDGAIVHGRGYGMADLERNVPITTRSVFDIGSTSKQFAAASVILLEQQGRLSLDDDVRTHIPELPEYARPITIRHLLHHSSGVRDYIGLLVLGGARIDDVTTPDDALTAIARQKALNFEPGDEHLYSNSGYFLLSVIVERVAGESLRDFARKHIFEPLGMRHTQYLGSYSDIIPDRALAYSRDGDGRLHTDISRWLQLGDGAVFTTVEDLLLWDANFYEPKVGGAALLRELHRRGVLTNGDTISYAAGLVVNDYRGLRAVNHGGAWGGYRAQLLRFPDERVSVATLCNLGQINSSQLAYRVADVVLADRLVPRPAAPARAEPAPAGAVVDEATLAAIAGLYRDPATRVMRTIALEDGRLYLVAGGARYELRPTSATEFQLLDAPVAVTLTAEAATASGPRRLRWAPAGSAPSTLDRLAIVAPGPAELEEYAGSFHSEELDAAFTLLVDDGALVLRRRGSDPDRLRPLVRDEFSMGSAGLRFSRAADGSIDGFLLDLGRVRNLRFERSAPAR
jgi:CubicO group peptidase (beta-lactamase class C family)